MLDLFTVYPRADIYYYTQLSVTGGDADPSFHTESLWVSPLPTEHSGVIYLRHKCDSFLWPGYFMSPFPL